MAVVIGIDVGTSSTKTVLFDEAGVPVCFASREYPLHQPQNGWAEQDPEDWWRATVETIAEVMGKGGVQAQDVKGVGISGQMHGLVMLDGEGKVLRPAILWCDQRTAAQCADITRRVGAERLIAVTANPALTGFTASKILWVRENDPASYEKCKHVLLPKDYIRYKLTGEFATEVSDASGMQLLDVPGRCWSDEVLDKLEIDKSWLAKVYESPEVTGKVHAQTAKLTGLAEGTPVVGGAGDNAAAAVGTGVVRDGTAFTTIGSSGVVYAHSSKISIDPKGRVHTFCCAVPGAWHVMGVTQGAGLSLQWFRNQFCEGMSYREMDALAKEIPVGSDNLFYLPYLMGERTPHLDPNCRGVFFGLSGIHTRAHLIRAVMEGVGYSLRDCQTILMGMGIEIQSMMACGGGSAPFWSQMLADLYHCPVQTLQSKEGPALGVAILAAVGAGLYASVPEACDAIIHTDRTANPDAACAAQYDKGYPLFNKLYDDLKETFALLGK